MPSVRPRIGGGNLLGIKLDSQALISGARNALGQFQRGLLTVQEINQAAGESVQQSVLKAFDSSLVRPQRPTHWLRDALAAPEAIRSNIDGFLYLPEGYLESSKARLYWRGLEQGTSVHEGQVIYGFFRSLEGTLSAPSPELFRHDVTFEPRHSADSRIRRGPSPRFIRIRRPITAHSYLEKGIRDWAHGPGVNQLRQRYRKAFSD